MQKLKDKKLLFIGIHVLLGILIVFTPRSLNKLFGLLLFVIGLGSIYLNKNKNEEAFVFSFYYMSIEVFLRMTKSSLSWEFGKYAVIIYLITGMLLEKNKRELSVLFIFYLLLISIGIVFTELPASASYRKAILFNITGPYVLGIAALYFYKRKISFEKLKIILWIGVLPTVSMIVYLFFRTPSLKELVFNSAASFGASGGFGPNQVATSLGFGIFLIGTLLLLKYEITGFIIADFILLFYVVYRCLLTFSRGGFITGVSSLFIMLVFYLLSKGSSKVIVKYIGIIAVFITAVWVFSSNITGGMLDNRYLGRNSIGEKKEDISSGRTDIIEDQLANFYEHPFLGLGVGTGDYKRKEKYDGAIMSTSHNEVGRLIEEHGVIGILSLLLLMFSSLSNFIKHSLLFKGLIASFALLWFLTINHSAMRIAFPGFIYGLSLIHIYKEDDLING